MLMRVIFPGRGIKRVVSLRPLTVSRGLSRLRLLQFGVSVYVCYSLVSVRLSVCLSVSVRACVRAAQLLLLFCFI